MTHMVELRYIGGDLDELMRDMRGWLDHHGIEPEELHHSASAPGLAFRVAFKHEDHAGAFAQAFGGWIECADPERGPHWAMPPSKPPG